MSEPPPAGTLSAAANFVIDCDAPPSRPESPMAAAATAEQVCYLELSLPQALMNFMETLDPKQTGYVSRQELEKVTMLLRAPVTSAGSQHMPPPESKKKRSTKVLESFDFDGDGTINTLDLEFAHAREAMGQERRKRDCCIIMALLGALLVLSMAMFGVSYAAVEMAKEVHVSQNGVLESSEGEVVRVGSADMRILEGAMFQAGPETAQEQCNNRTGSCAPLPHGGYSHAIATRTAEELRPLNSRTADDVFQNLNKISLQLTGQDGVAMNVTFAVHGFMRTRTNTNECGSVVRLDVLHGTLIIDGSNIHFDHKLLQHFQSQGFHALTGGPVSLFGRRLSGTTVFVLGIFSLFEDYECECFNVTEPTSPKLPYAARLLEKRPCTTPDMCMSKVFEGQYLPGYDPVTDTILTHVSTVVHQDYTITVHKYPNHPVQEQIIISKHAEKTTRVYQMSAETVTRCYNETYSPVTTLGVDAWYAEYLGEADYESETFWLLGENYTIEGGKRRKFRLQLKNATGDSYPVDYEDDAQTLTSRKVCITGARVEGWDIECAEMLEFDELDDAEADAILAEHEAMVSCDGQSKSFPRMKGAFEESLQQVVFYALDLQSDPGMSAANDSYWSHAIAAIDDAFLQDYYAALNATAANATFDRRRLLSHRRLAARGFQAKFDKKNSIEVAIDTDRDGHVCVGVVGNTGGDTGWFVGGELSMGDNCGSQPGRFAVSGSVTVGYTWGVQKKLLGYKIGCSLTIWGSIGANTGSFGYDCGRRLAEEDGDAPLTLPDDEGESEAENLEDDLEEVTPALSDDVAQNTSLNALAYNEEEETEGGEELEGRRLWGRRRRRRRRRTCYAAGVEIDAGIGIDGGCSAGVSVGVSGSFDLNIGPFPQPPLDSEITGALSAKACINLWAVSGCINIGSLDLFSIDI